MARRFFGTDGIRGRVGEYPITPDFMLKLGWAAGRTFSKLGHGSVIVGKDTRISGYMFESALQAGLAAAGMDVGLLGPMPTPGIAYLTRTFHAKCGIVISASHNPHEDNGIKFFSAEGKKLPDEIEEEIESYLDQALSVNESSLLGKARRIEDARGRYIEFCKGTIPYDVSLKGMKIVLDCANGATYNIAPHVFSELGAEVIRVGCEPDGLNINYKCGSTHPDLLQQKVVAHKADIGVALDGDGDRVIMVDHKGDVVDGDELLFVITRFRHQTGSLQGGVVGTLMTNFGFEQAISGIGVPFIRAKVGDRYVMAELEKNDWKLGGESSGHIVCLDKTTTGDGIVSTLQVLHAMSHSGLRLAELRKAMIKMPQTMINVKFSKKANLAEHEDVQAEVDKVQTKLGGSGRVLLRPSGTEPVIRVMVEGEDAKSVAAFCEQIADVIRKVAV